MTPCANPPLVRLPEKLAYGLGDAACNLFWKTFTVFLMFYYTDVFGLAAASVGTMFLLTRLFDAVTDPLMGVIADRTRTRWGRFRPYLLWVAVPFGFCGVLVFTRPAGLGPAAMLAYAYVTYSLVMLAYTAINIPYGALVGVISPHSQERTSLAAFRFVFAFGGSLLVQKATLPLVGALGGGNQALGFQLAFGVWAALAVVFFFLSFAGTRERVEPPPGQRSDLRRDLADLVRNVPWVFVLLLTLCLQIAACVRDGSIMYYFKYYMNDTGLAANFMVAGSAASVIAILFIPAVVRRLGKKPAFILLLAIAAAAMVGTYWVHPGQVAPAFALHIVVNLCMGPAMVVITAMKADTVDYSEWRNRRRATGLIFSAASLASKLGWAFGGALTGWVLALFGYEANVVQSAHTQHGIRIVISFLPAVAAVAGIVITTFYRLDEATVRTIEADLAARRQAAGLG